MPDGPGQGSHGSAASGDPSRRREQHQRPKGPHRGSGDRSDNRGNGDGTPELLNALLKTHLDAQSASKDWVQGVRMGLALVCIGMAFFVSYRLVVEGPPPPATPDPPKNSKPSHQPNHGNRSPASATSKEPASSLNEEAPWAFAIIALLVAAFLGAGQTLSFGGDSGGDTDDDSKNDGGGGDHERRPEPPAPPSEEAENGPEPDQTAPPVREGESGPQPNSPSERPPEVGGAVAPEPAPPRPDEVGEEKPR